MEKERLDKQTPLMTMAKIAESIERDIRIKRLLFEEWIKQHGKQRRPNHE